MPTPDTGTLSITGAAPVINTTIVPAVGTMTVTGVSSSLSKVVDIPLEFEALRQHGRIPQVALLMRLVTRTVVATADGIATNQLPDNVEELIHDGLQVGDLVEGSDGDQMSLEVQPGRQASFRVRIANTTGKMSQFLMSDPLIGADAELILSFPGLDGDHSFSRFKGEILGIVLDDFSMEIEAGSP